MSSLLHLNAFISERLTAAAVEILGAVEKTLIEYQGEISRSKREVDHLRTLVLWPEVRLHRSAHQVSPRGSDDEEASPERCHEEDWAPHASPDHQSGTLRVKVECDQSADQRGASCRQQRDTAVSPQLVKGEGREEPPSQPYSVPSVEQTAGIKAEPGGEEAEVPCRGNPESAGLQRESLRDRDETTDHEQDGPDEQQYTEQGWSPRQDHKDPDPPQVKVEKFTSSSPRGEADLRYEAPPRSERSVYDELCSFSPRHNPTVSNQTFYTALEERREGYDLSGLSRTCLPFYSVNQCEYGDSTDSALNGDWIKVLTTSGTRPKKRQNANLCTEGRESFGAEEDLNSRTRERRHTCPICGKRFKESSHLKDHVRIHTGEKPYQCKECGVKFRQSGALTLHMRIHTGDRPYQCADCGRRFNRKGDMETHRVTHTGERPHLCLVCGKSFKRKSNLNTHLKLHA
ncbi:zinc finger and SCAN domain-containing protein 2-like isoform X2 [Acanthopagrus latus]|uniref:zinc finger and SCAN domain-containing protein 2-like isoform X2 n=1 Tax=Acanthopagrus latus TaxID=8177 RepID=UPI00187BF733|nr:zinc finger and SCAN domain-containing protein 2-like isoform X2 [Acanthopagrus latus]